MCWQVLQQMEESVTATACKLAIKITLLDGILLMKAAWKEIDSVTIRNCWVKAGLKMCPRERPAHTSQMIVPSELPMIQKQWKDFMKTDDDLQVVHVLDVDESVDIVRARHEDKEENDDDEDEVTITETRNALNSPKRGLMGRGFIDHDNLLTKLEKASSQILIGILLETAYYISFFP